MMVLLQVFQNSCVRSNPLASSTQTSGHTLSHTGHIQVTHRNKWQVQWNLKHHNTHCNTQDTHRTHGKHNRTGTGHTLSCKQDTHRTHTPLDGLSAPPPLQMSAAAKEGRIGFMISYPFPEHCRLLDWWQFKPLIFEYTKCILQVLHWRNQPLLSSMVRKGWIPRWHPLSLLQN